MENSKKIDKFIDNASIEKVLSRLVPLYKPKVIYLYGSYAWGTPDQYSDIDLCIIVEDSSQKQVERIRNGLRELKGIHFPVDILVFTIEEIDEHKDHPSTLINKVLRKGIKLYEAA
jgi:predicted nucleotidyltransferase